MFGFGMKYVIIYNNHQEKNHLNKMKIKYKNNIKLIRFGVHIDDYRYGRMWNMRRLY